MERLAQGKFDIVVGRLFERHDKTGLRYEPLVEEPIGVVARPGHALCARPQLALRDLAGAGWIVPPAGSVLRHRFDLMFQEQGLAAPTNLIESAAVLFLTKMLQQSDLLAVLAVDVARYYEQHGMVAVLPVALQCKMDAFGIITRSDRLPSPAAKVMLRALKAAALTVYGTQLELAAAE
jgi:DNA-binding transcriptional LysR family regulator